MIFIILGSQKFQFNRLLKAVDDLLERNLINDKVFAQIGYSDYKPKMYEYCEFLNRDEFNNIINESDIVITHGGTGSIIRAVKNEKKVIAVPRLVEYGEHVDNHQLQLLKEFKEMNLIYACSDLNNLNEVIKKVKLTNFSKYVSNTSRILDSIDSFIINNISN